VSLELSVSELHFGGRRLFTGIVRDLTESKARARQQAAMVEFGQRALACTDLEELLQEAAQCVAQTLDVEHGYVLWNCPRAATRWCSEGARAGTRGRLDGKSSTPVKTTQWAECLPRKR